MVFHVELYHHCVVGVLVFTMTVFHSGHSQTSEKGGAKLGYQGYDEGEDARVEAEYILHGHYVK